MGLRIGGGFPVPGAPPAGPLQRTGWTVPLSRVFIYSHLAWVPTVCQRVLGAEDAADSPPYRHRAGQLQCNASHTFQYKLSGGRIRTIKGNKMNLKYVFISTCSQYTN